ncbi:uncharacterized protein BCR38DRAFT_452387 [Pseudomassariella vexata]|uniref:Lysyl-tRNA synthetase n=1 Tax=Pseudomassariella vexata TaxID=1141098 RepID=A0A1Y2D873_9PEZI|nr:uncharacterized protein BCR38DRAFT_452387 [Pseudomassariella vexata]ORY55468.1 hypothetical protein BCR38DRAFT_452387 [Pseudomassariella vexata]
MGGRRPLRLLRPYAFQLLPRKPDLYCRFYSVIRSTCAGHDPSNRSRLDARECSRQVYTLARQPVSATESPSTVKAKRIKKLEQFNALQYPRLPILTPDDPPTLSITVAEFRQRYDDLSPDVADIAREVTLQGRITAIRRLGSKLVFLDIQGSFAKVQVQIGSNAFSEQVTHKEFKDAVGPLLRGDFVSLTGTPCRTNVGELTLRLTKLPKLMSPSLLPIPESLVDEETMVQNRSMDLLVNPKSSDLLRFRSDLIWWLRNYFREGGFMEVQTPILSDYAGGATARPFLTSATEFPNKELALRIAPELWLKRLVVGGFDKIYEIGPAFRNEGLDATHNPEFTMCEFYSAFSSLQDLCRFTQDLIRYLAKQSDTVISAGQYASLEPIDHAYFDLRIKKIQFIPGLEKAIGIKFPDLQAPDALDQLVAELTEKKFAVTPDLTLNKLLDRLAGVFLERISFHQPIFITHHPACMSPLAKSFICPETGQLVSARAELFIKGAEIANMYEEENNPFEQRRKFEQQVQAAESGDAEAVEGRVKVDESFIQALECGLPPTGGWGCGIDRLVMLFSGAKRISSTLAFGNLRHVVSPPKMEK